tara:strand:+ start:27 stop:830 length:804 start_codon:yes stop_codon:yes gene_type:complete
MKIIKNILELNKAIKDYKNIGFVPTMGGIHNGHASLIKISQRNKGKTIVSIFVNPTQFNDKKDFKKYPRNIKRDIAILKKLKVNYLFLPEAGEIYKKKMKDFALNKSDKILCAKYRKGHFEGVLNVMNRLLSIIKPKEVFMGEKDFQQYTLIKRILGKKYNIKIIGCPTIREKNKIALSTRNKLLSNSAIKKASEIANKLLKLKQISKTNNLINLSKLKKNLENKYKIQIDYLEFRDEKKLKLNNFKSKYRLFIAFYINGVRLIDNF